MECEMWSVHIAGVHWPSHTVFVDQCLQISASSTEPPCFNLDKTLNYVFPFLYSKSFSQTFRIFSYYIYFMGVACGTYGGRERCAQGFGGEIRAKETTGETKTWWEDNIKMDLQELGRGCVFRMEFAQDRDRWRALVSTVMNFRVP